MFTNMTEQQARNEILKMVEQYGQRYHRPKHWKEGDKISYAGRVYDEQELLAVVDAALEFWLTNGRYTKTFEQQLAEYLGVKYCSMVNSGSSANLLAFMALTSPLLNERRIKPGDEVITVACGFPTTVTPILQYGAVPVFLDVTIPQYNIDVRQLEEALSHKTKAIMIAHTLGNPFDLETIKAFCQKYQLWLIEDNCDALGSVYELHGDEKLTGTIGDIGTSSFYPPHHITTGEGGAVYTNDPLLHKIIRSMRDWGRDCVCESGQDNRCGYRFEQQLGQLPYGYDHKYVYSHFGYNLKATELQAAIGCAQLKKLPTFIAKRQEHFERLKAGLADLGQYLILPEAQLKSKPSWFGFLITCQNGVNRDRIVAELESKGIQTRMLFAGNLIKQPCFDTLRKANEGYRICGSLDNTDRIMQDTFWVGLYPAMTEDMLEYMIKAIRYAVENAIGSNAER